MWQMWEMGCDGGGCWTNQGGLTTEGQSTFGELFLPAGNPNWDTPRYSDFPIYCKRAFSNHCHCSCHHGSGKQHQQASSSSSINHRHQQRPAHLFLHIHRKQLHDALSSLFLQSPVQTQSGVDHIFLAGSPACGGGGCAD